MALRARVTSLALAVLLVTALAAPVASVRADAAAAPFVLSALHTLQKNYVDTLTSVPLLNAALTAAEKKAETQPLGSAIPETASDDQAVALFTQRFAEIVAKATGRLTETDLAYAAVDGMLQSLHDSHTGFVPPSLYQEIKRRENGQAAFTGVGIVLLHRDGQYYISEIYPGGPAEQAGIHVFDRIVGVDGHATTNLAEDDVSQMIRGTSGVAVTLTVTRTGSSTPIDIAIVRQPIHVPTVTDRMLDGQIGYVRLYEFVPGVGSGIRNAMQDLRSGGMQALVLDLRGNPGGLVSELRDVSAAFLPQGSPVLQMRTRTGRSVVMQTSNPPVMPAALPMVVLVDEGTASAAELLSAAIQEQGRGVIEGTKTAGAVEIGITIDLPEGAGMSVTVARVLTGKGTRLEGQGVTPDTAEDLTSQAMDQGRDSQLDRAVQILDTQLGVTKPANGFVPPAVQTP
ncbi:MAG TPA: S41 family peptidase [bacterium]|nr:S41 family peptidase [bacterium]